MYESFFRFHDRPFAAAPVIDTYYPAETIEQSRQNLIRIVERAEGPGLIVGPAGVGKSLLCRLLAEYFRDRFDVVILSSARITTRKALLQNILFELGLPYRDSEEGELRLSLLDFLQPGNSSENGMLLIVDEAHALPMRLLDEIRMITNLVRDGQVRVRLVLAGGPRLEERFAHPKLESFNQRLAARCYLDAIGREDCFRYVHSQIAAAGGDAAKIFDDSVQEAIYQATGGIPRLVNQICDHALVLGCAGGHRQLSGARIEEAWSDLQQLPGPWETPVAQVDAGDGVVEFGSWDEEEHVDAKTESDSVDNVASSIDELEMELPSGELSVDEGTPPEVDDVGSEDDAIFEGPYVDGAWVESPFHDETSADVFNDTVLLKYTELDEIDDLDSAVIVQDNWESDNEHEGPNDPPIMDAPEGPLDRPVDESDVTTDEHVEDDAFEFNTDTATGVVAEEFANSNEAAIEVVEINVVETGIEPAFKIDVIDTEIDAVDLTDGQIVDDLDAGHSAGPLSDPFGEFAEEETVLDSTTARSIESFQGRPAVSTDLGRQLAAAFESDVDLDPTGSEGESGDISNDQAVSESPGELVTASHTASIDQTSDSFEYTIQEDAGASDVSWIGASCDFTLPEVELNPDPTIVEKTVDDDCVTFPFSAETKDDDRNLIIVEGEEVDESELDAAKVSRTLEYRELFGQLRKA
jgi:type II secretory pathway predicted ATPase ExeA